VRSNDRLFQRSCLEAPTFLSASVASVVFDHLLLSVPPIEPLAMLAVQPIESAVPLISLVVDGSVTAAALADVVAPPAVAPSLAGIDPGDVDSAIAAWVPHQAQQRRTPEVHSERW